MSQESFQDPSQETVQLPTQEVLHTSLLRRCEDDRKKGLTAAILKDLDNPAHQLTLIAVFYSDIVTGGFARFVYNANGIYLPEVAEVLEQLKASAAVKALDEVMQFCIDANEDYQAFLSGDFSESEFKRRLNDFSEVYAMQASLIEEIPQTLQKLLRKAS